MYLELNDKEQQGITWEMLCMARRSLNYKHDLVEYKKNYNFCNLWLTEIIFFCCIPGIVSN